MEVAIISMMIIGLILIVISVFLVKKDTKERENINQKLDEAFNIVNLSLDNFEAQTNEFNKTCELIFTEIGEKYQELLYLYSVIEEHKNNNKDILENNISEISSKNKEDTIIEVQKIVEKKTDNSFIFKNKNAVEIFKLYDEGIPIPEIAKKLSIGQGEIKFMLNIRKA